VFGRSVPPEPFAYWVWLLSAPLMGLVFATYVVPSPPAPPGLAQPFVMGDAATVERRSIRLGGVASFAAFLAIGCPVCNKVALVLLAITAAWRLRLRADGGACPA
jgi:hypothetical protein